MRPAARPGPFAAVGLRLGLVFAGTVLSMLAASTPGAVTSAPGSVERAFGGPTCPDFGCGANHNQVLL